MGDFFHGWRRKLGLLTLVMACVIASAWMRSGRITDRLTIRSDDHTIHWIISGNHWIGWIMVQSDDALPATNHTWLRYPVSTGWDYPERDTPFSAVNIRWKFRHRYHPRRPNQKWGRGEFLMSNPSDPNLHFIVPYPVIVIPLMVVSAYLLLIKPRKSTSMKITEPTSAEGT